MAMEKVTVISSLGNADPLAKLLHGHAVAVAVETTIKAEVPHLHGLQAEATTTTVATDKQTMATEEVHSPGDDSKMLLPRLPVVNQTTVTVAILVVGMAILQAGTVKAALVHLLDSGVDLADWVLLLG